MKHSRELYACKVLFHGDYGYTEDEVRWELCERRVDPLKGETWTLYTRHPSRYYQGHEIDQASAIFVTPV